MVIADIIGTHPIGGPEGLRQLAAESGQSLPYAFPGGHI